MRRRIIYRAFFLLVFTGAVFGQEFSVSGILDSSVNFTAAAGGAENSWGMEEYANLRIRTPAGEKGTFFAAFNLAALSGNYMALAPQAVLTGDNYAALMELERLYFRLNGDYLDIEAGLLRMAFGYGLVWGSSDFLNPRNPLLPDSRPRGVLGTTFAFYPGDEVRLQVFAAAPKNPLESEGGGIMPGISVDSHWERASLQGLYVYETPGDGFGQGRHRFGLSLKADLELGFVLDALYTLDPVHLEGIEGLSAGGGFDYSFFDGKFYFLTEYLFNGTSQPAQAGFSNSHYLYGSLMYRFNDYASLTLSDISCLDDPSHSPAVTGEYELFQGFTLSLSGRFPLGKGELGPEQSRSGFIMNAKARLRF
jgi:hypothetical protein